VLELELERHYPTIRTIKHLHFNCLALADEMKKGINNDACQSWIFERSIRRLMVQPAFNADEAELPGMYLPGLGRQVRGFGTCIYFRAISCQIEQSLRGDAAMQTGGDEVGGAWHVPVRKIAMPNDFVVQGLILIVGRDSNLDAMVCHDWNRDPQVSIILLKVSAILALKSASIP